MIGIAILIFIVYVYYKQQKRDEKRAKEWMDKMNK